ncbi:hypothetical protein [Amycolatopsis thermoflava]|uniref:hypothetical protein n=1 Tax=Amycolatopsis thermoflava TaxID=84480 RepID=UPI00040151EB|nr:hypothetical protein [Amycolatopsis thermoflava]
MTPDWVRSPIGIDSDRWTTLGETRKILIVAHNMASANRLLDVLALFDSDHRIQVVHTCPQTGIPAGVAEHFREQGFVSVPWHQAVETAWDLVITANTSGDLHELHGPLMVLSHGIGYSKRINRKPETGNRKPETGNRKPETGNRKPETGNRKPETGNRKPVYGLSPESLFSGGRLVPDVLVLSHAEQLDRLVQVLPAAADRTVVAGDPRFDRILASLGERKRYRSALGLADREVLVLVSSTWWRRSLFGTWPDLVRQLLAELPLDRYRVAAVLHPHIWFGHGPAQVRAWLAACLRAGLILVPPQEGWAAALVAADLVIGDHGAVTTYAAAIDRPVLLATFPADDVAEHTAVHALGGTAPLLGRQRPVRAQVDEALAQFRPGRHRHLASLVSALPGRSAGKLRELCYTQLDLAEPPGPVPVPVLPIPEGLERAALAVRVSGSLAANGVISVARHPADALLGRATEHPRLADAHLVAVADHPLPAIRGHADVIVRRGSDLHWLEEAFDRHPFSAMAACVPDEGTCWVRIRDGVTFRCRVDGADPLLAASALYVWWSHRGAQPPPSLFVDTGSGPAVPVELTAVG